MMLLLGAALAAGPEAFPIRAGVPLPPAGPARVVLGADLVGAAPERLSESVLIVDGAGGVVPYAALLSTGPDEANEESLRFQPVGRDIWEVEDADEPLDALVLSFGDLAASGPFLVRAEVRDGAEWRLAAQAVLYEIDSDLSERELRVPHRRGPWRIQAHALGEGDPSLYGVSGRTFARSRVEPIREVYDLSDPVLTEAQRARYVVPLAGLRAVTAISLDVTDDLFSREVSVGHPTASAEPSFSGSGRIRRVRIGDTQIERTRVTGFREADDRLIIDVETDRGRMLTIPRVTVESVGAELVLRDAGAGPHVLYVGASEPQRPYDLATAVPALLRLDPPRVATGAAEPNPLHVQLATRAGVDAPGAALNVARFRWARALTGPPGWTRIELDDAVLAHARPDLADLRVVDAEGRQVPFLARFTGRERPVRTGPLVREEKGSASEIRVPLADGSVPLASIHIRTPFELFEREISLLRDRGRATETLRRVSWSAPTQGGTLAISVGEPLGDAILLRIENGDNPPLPITDVRATTPVWELRVRIPEGGARLVYGIPGESAPVYDLSLLQGEVARMPLEASALGPEERLGTPSQSARDSVIVVIGIGFLAVGLLGMTIRVLTGVAAPEAGSGGAG